MDGIPKAMSLRDSEGAMSLRDSEGAMSLRDSKKKASESDFVWKVLQDLGITTSKPKENVSKGEP